MNGKRILIPLDLQCSFTESQFHLRQTLSEYPFCATLLYVVELNIVAPDTHLYQKICAESEAALRNLSLTLLGHESAARISVRIGRADEQILVEAEESRSKLIILTRFERRWSHIFPSHTVERVVQFAPRPTLVLPLDRNIAVAGECRPDPRPREVKSPIWVVAGQNDVIWSGAMSLSGNPT